MNKVEAGEELRKGIPEMRGDYGKLHSVIRRFKNDHCPRWQNHLNAFEDYYGLNGLIPLTQKEIGEKMGLSHSRAGKLVNKARRMLRNPKYWQ